MTNEYYIEEDFAILAGPFTSGPTDQKYMHRVIDDMKRGNIPWKVQYINGEAYIERKGMILPKRKS